MDYLITIAVVAAIAAAIYFRKPLKRLFVVGEAQANEVARNAENSAAIAMQQKRIDGAKVSLRDWRNKLAKANGGVLAQTRVVDGLVNEVAALEKMLQARRTRILQLKEVPAEEADAAREGRENLLRRTLTNTSRKMTELNQKKGELAQAKTLFEQFRAQAKQATGKLKEVQGTVEDAEEQLGTDRTRLDMAEMHAEIAEATSSMGDFAGTTVSGLKDGAEAVQRRIDNAIARAETVQDLDMDPDAELDEELAEMDSAAEAEANLADFLASGSIE